LTELDPTTVDGLAEHCEIVAANLEEEDHWVEVEAYVKRLRLAAAKLREQDVTIMHLITGGGECFG